jgi:hypothetical protein
MQGGGEEQWRMLCSGLTGSVPKGIYKKCFLFSIQYISDVFLDSAVLCNITATV